MKKKRKKINKVDFFWKANINKRIKKSVDWYWIFWIMNLFLIYSSYYYWENKYLSIILFLVGIIITFSSDDKPQMISYRIVDDGFIIDNKKEIFFNDIESFNIDYDKNYIFLKLKKNNLYLTEIPFEDDHKMEIIEDFLIKKIKKNSNLKIPPLEEFFRDLLGFQ